MKKNKNSIRTGLFSFGAVFMMMFLFTACRKSSDNNNTITPVAGLLSLNLAPDRPSVGLAISGSLLTGAPLSYSSFTGYYQNIYPGSREVAACNFYGGDSAFASATATFEQNKL